MGNSLRCSASGERLVSAARDGDLVEARMLLEINPCLARYSTFGGLNSPLHFAAAKCHCEIVVLLLEKGADVNCRNYCGQTALMQACRHGHWEVVQALLLYRCNVTRADDLSGRTALHFAAVDGHVRCLRLLAADFVPSVSSGNGGRSSILESSSGHGYDHAALVKFINKPANGGITALHIAALSRQSECVQLLLDLLADVTMATFPYGTSINFIGGGSTPLHYAACGGNIRCCQMLLSRGASRLSLNQNGWLPTDVARMWGHHNLEPLLAPNAELQIPVFPPSNYISLPLMSILDIARDLGLQALDGCDERYSCPICFERTSNVVAAGCSHQFCVKCALYLCSTGSFTSETLGPPGSIPCPLCRNGIISFTKLPVPPAKDLKPNPALSFCTPCIHSAALDPPSRSDIRKNGILVSDLICLRACGPFPFANSLAITTCKFDVDHQCPSGDVSEESAAGLSDTIDEQRLERTNCSGIFWGRRSCQREQQCNAEINA